MYILFLISYGYEFITVMLPAVAVMIAFHLLYRKQGENKSRWHVIYLIAFSVYLFGVYHFTGAGTLYDAKMYGLEINAQRINLIPFSDTEIDLVAYGLNVILFVPLGFLLPLIWSNFEKIKYVFISGFSLSAIVELSQLLNNRSTDVDDLILNTIGAILGVLLFKLFSCIAKPAPVQTNSHKYEMIVLVMATFLCRFLTYNEMGMARILFKF